MEGKVWRVKCKERRAERGTEMVKMNCFQYDECRKGMTEYDYLHNTDELDRFRSYPSEIHLLYYSY